MTTDFSLLTAKQKKVYMAIDSYIKEKGIPPTVREIGELVGEKTPGAVQGILNRLEYKGMIKRELGMARSIQLVTGTSFYLDPVYVPEIKKVTQRNLNDLLNVYNIVRYHPISPDLFDLSDKCFILHSADTSMVQSGIMPEDLLVVNTGCDIGDSSLVLLEHAGHIVLRRFYSTACPDAVKLEADYDIFERDLFYKNEITLIGKVVGRLTRY